MEIAPGLVRSGLGVLNRAGGALERVGLAPVSLHESKLLDAARRAPGCSEFGGDEFRGPLRVLLRSLASEVHLTLLGRIAARADLAGLLDSRLRLAQDRIVHPGDRRRADLAAAVH